MSGQNFQKKALFTYGRVETTILTNKINLENIGKILKEEETIQTFPNVSSITIHLPHQALLSPGIIYFFLKSLAWEEVNILDILSTHTELTLIFSPKDINSAFAILQSLFEKEWRGIYIFSSWSWTCIANTCASGIKIKINGRYWRFSLFLEAVLPRWIFHGFGLISLYGNITRKRARKRIDTGEGNRENFFRKRSPVCRPIVAWRKTCCQREAPIGIIPNRQSSNR